MPKDIISVVAACRNVAPFIDEALMSVRRQSHDALQIVVVDDGSTDDTRARIEVHAGEDERILLVRGQGRGPGAARNLALDQAVGDWVAVVDGDDVLHPERLEIMLRRAVDRHAEGVMDNLLAFYDDGTTPSHLLIDEAGWAEERWIDLPCFIASNNLLEDGPSLGYLKPLVRRSALRGVRYDETLRIGEDYDFVAHLLKAGAGLLYLPEAFYFYRRHAASTSFRLREQDVASLLAAAETFEALLPDGEAKEASKGRRAALHRARAFCAGIDALKRRHVGDAVKAMAASPGALPLVRRALTEAVQKRLRHRPLSP